MKTHSGAKKRVKVSKGGKGKIIRQRANVQHLFENKSSRRKRRLAVDVEASAPDSKVFLRLLGKR